MSRDARNFRERAEANGHPAPAHPKTDADEQGASTLVALAVRETGAGPSWWSDAGRRCRARSRSGSWARGD
ncbi:hypothetical protein ACH4MM_32445 [Streptomyces pratensis]|uniref:hypothetical protein n=1 Tax=Streptomyces pratensis TaxID=1169025 RepID=UPI00378DC1C8